MGVAVTQQIVQSRDAREQANLQHSWDFAVMVLFFAVVFISNWVFHTFLTSSLFLCIFTIGAAGSLVHWMLRFLTGRGLRLFDQNMELHDKWCYPSGARTVHLTGYLRWSDGYFTFYFIQNLKSVVDSSGCTEVMFVGAGSGYDLRLALPRFRILMPGVKYQVTDLYPHTKVWEYMFASMPEVTCISESVDAAHVKLNKPKVLVLKFMVHHLKRDLVKSVIKNAIDNKSPIVIYDMINLGLLGILLIPLFVALRLPFIMTMYFVNNYRMGTLALAILWSPLVALAYVWDCHGPALTGYTYYDYCEILEELGYEPGGVEYSCLDFNALYVCIIDPNTLKAKKQNKDLL